MLTIAFHTPNLNFRGSCVALYDYAHYSETLLGHKSLILTDYHQRHTNDAIAFKWITSRFPLYSYDSIEALEHLLEHHHVDVLYCIKYGTRDGVVSRRVKTVIHCVFDMSEPHGHVYAGVSQSLAAKFGSTTYVPHMISMVPTQGDDLRARLGIPKDALVFGRHGGRDTFNLEWAKHVFSATVRERSDVYFVFLNADAWDTHPRIILLDATTDEEEKKRFIRTLDCALCPESLGHTFGTSLGQTCAYNKPAIIYNGPVWNRAHVDIMGDKGLYFDTPETLHHLIATFDPMHYKDKDLNAYKAFDPTSVMAQFQNVFL